jgi:hypothetical protein
VKNLLEDPENKDDFTTVTVVPKQRSKEDREESRNYKRVTRAPEAVLSINLDFE